MGVTLVGHVGVGPVTPNLDSTPVTNHYKNSFTGGGIHWQMSRPVYLQGRGKGATIRCRKIGFVLKYGQCTGWGGKSGRCRTNHRATARCLWQRARALLNTTRWASQITLFSDRSYAGGSGGHPLTLYSTNPVQGMKVDGALGSTTMGVMEGDGTPAACSTMPNENGQIGTQGFGWGKPQKPGLKP